ncbi:hypothetical protein SAMN04488109_4630 [Chryseolinea serpens]|uniref:Uncharacterized protein n=1 Tax=Chryseolinea serpens TaxID=947013 RepID=A0A1M5UE57_9BACT|nr:hypothetical protein SAMN04488109_4630 [Chryseolinea serpens]
MTLNLIDGKFITHLKQATNCNAMAGSLSASISPPLILSGSPVF